MAVPRRTSTSILMMNLERLLRMRSELCPSPRSGRDWVPAGTGVQGRGGGCWADTASYLPLWCQQGLKKNHTRVQRRVSSLRAGEQADGSLKATSVLCRVVKTTYVSAARWFTGYKSRAHRIGWVKNMSRVNNKSSIEIISSQGTIVVTSSRGSC